MFVCGGARQLQLSLLSLSLSALEPKALYELGHPHSLASSKSTETQMAGMGLWGWDLSVAVDSGLNVYVAF
jgi:hypothetical protein